MIKHHGITTVKKYLHIINNALDNSPLLIKILVACFALVYISSIIMIWNYKDLLLSCKNHQMFYGKSKIYLWQEYIILAFSTLFMIAVNVVTWYVSVDFVLKIII